MSTIDEQFVEFVVKSLVNNPDDVKIERTIDKLGVLIKLTVNPEDLGRVIGKRGATAQSLRTLLRALGTKNEARYNLKIVDNGAPRPDREEQKYGTDEDESERSVAPAKKVPLTETAQDSPSNEPKTSKETLKSAVADKPKIKEKEAETSDEDDTLAKRTMDELKDLDDLEV